MLPWPYLRQLLLTAGSIFVAVLAIFWGSSSSSSSSSSTARDSIHYDVPYAFIPAGAAVPAEAPWYIHHAKWLAANTAAAEAMQSDLNSVWSTISSKTTLEVTTAALKGSKLPKKVTLQQAQQLLMDKQLLAHSLGSNGFAAARVAALQQHYKSASGPSSPAATAATAADCTTADGSRCQTSAADTAADQQQQQQQQQQSDEGCEQDSTASRGILIVGGSRTHLGNAYILLKMLREQFECQLPVEVVYYGPKELDPAAASLVRSFAAAQAAAGAAPITLIDGLAVHQQYLRPLLPHPEVALTSWVAKVHALCWVTSLQQVLLLDSDNLPTQDPAVLFHSDPFVTHGFMTWPDFWHDLWMEPVVYRLLDVPVPWETDPQGLAAESGQLLIDRARHADVLEWLWLLNAHKGLVYQCLVGDKDTYKLAFELANKGHDYWQVPHPPRQLLLDAGSQQKRGRFIHLGMGQASPDGMALLFMHRTARGKFFPWCAASRQLQRGSGGCQPDWLTMPVVQEQLIASVPDPGSMRFDSGKLDIEWFDHGCEESPRGSLQDAGSVAGERAGVKSGCAAAWALQLPVCNYTQEQLPIPLIPVQYVVGMGELLEVVNGVFAEAAAVLSVPWVDRWKVFWGIL